MRLSLAVPAHGTQIDLDVPADAPLGSLRAELAGVVGDPALLHAPLTVDDTYLDDDHRTGHHPLLPGARLGVGPGLPDLATAALDAPLHLAVLDGPDAGGLRALTSPLVVGRGAAAVTRGAGGSERSSASLHSDVPARLVVADPTMSRSHVLLLPDADGTCVRARDLRSTTGTTAHLAGQRRRPRERRVHAHPWPGTRLRPGDRLTLGSTTVEVRAAPGRARAHDASQPEARPDASAGRTSGRGRTLALGLVPVCGAALLMTGQGSPVMLLLGLLAPALLSAWLLRPSGSGGPTTRRRRPGARGPRLSDETENASPGPADVATASVVALADRRALALDNATAHESGAPSWLDALAIDGALVLLGEAGPARALARALVLCGPVPSALDVRVGLDPTSAHLGREQDGAWGWSRWLPHEADLPGRRILVVEGDALTRRELEDWRGSAGPHDLLLLVRPLTVPAWSRSSVVVTTAGPVHHRPGAPPSTVHLPGVSAAWADEQARRVAALVHLRRRAADPDGALPRTVALTELPDLPALDPAGLLSAWEVARTTDRLPAQLGLGADGQPVTVDLAREGPHVLVAGTTGAGKSELLQTLLCSLALTAGPDELAFALVDFKGGAGFGACVDLPHVVGQVTDLDPGLARRALDGLRAELRRREHLLADAGATDLASWPASRAGRPARLVVVIDEFRALADDLPDLMPALLRLAAQGRSLGMHLVLATQRPAGAIGPDLRANVALRIALRVTDAADSLDVLDAPDAARIPPCLPGRALLRRGPGPLEPLQVAHADTLSRPGARVRRAPARGALPPEPATRGGGTEHVVTLCRTAAAASARHSPAAPWLEPLPERLAAEEVPALVTEGAVTPGAARAATSAAETALPLGLADLPEMQARRAATWDPADGHLLVLGGPSSGRTTTLRGLAAHALDAGLDVHVVAAEDVLPARAPGHASGPGPTPGTHPARGTVVSPEDPRRLVRLAQLLLARPRTSRPTLLLVDDWAQVHEAAATVARGEGAEVLSRLLTATPPGLAIAVAAGVAAPSGPAGAAFRHRLVLPVGDDLAEQVAGVPRAFSGSRRGPGRAVLLHPEDGALLCQVALPPVREPVARRAASLSPADPVVRLVPLPLHAPPGPLAPAGADVLVRAGGAVLVGAGGDEAAPVALPCTAGALVLGPPGSGRSTALGHVVAGLADAHPRPARPSPAGLGSALPGSAHPGARLPPPHLVVLTRDARLQAVARAAGARVHGLDRSALDAIEAVAALLAEPRGDERGETLPVVTPPDETPPQVPLADATLPEVALAGGSLARVTTLVVDDVDLLARLRPAAAEQLDRLLELAEQDDWSRVRCVVSARTGTAAGAYRGVLAQLRAAGTGIVLSPTIEGGADVLGTDARWACDPAHPRAPGRGVLVVGAGDAVPLQVWAPRVPAAGAADEVSALAVVPPRRARDRDPGDEEQRADRDGEQQRAPLLPPRLTDALQSDDDDDELPREDDRPGPRPADPQRPRGDDEHDGHAEEERREEDQRLRVPRLLREELTRSAEGEHERRGDLDEEEDDDEHPHPGTPAPAASRVTVQGVRGELTVVMHPNRVGRTTQGA